jgi:hypothetical protein
MVDRPDARAASDASPTPAAERRRRVALRRLVDEMLDEIRAAANEDNWTAISRSQAELDLARIMTQVRREAVKRPGSASSRGSKRAAKTRAKQSAERIAKSTAKRSARKKKPTRKKAKPR